MKRECEQLRIRALTHGENSREYAAWVRHSHNCPDCQSEMFIMDTLQEQAAGERVHLPRESVAKLALIAQARYGKRRKRRPLKMMWGVIWKVSALAAMIVVLLQILPLELHHGDEYRGPAYDMAQLARVAQSEFDNPSIAWENFPAQATVLGVGETDVDSNLPREMESILPGQLFESRIRETSRQINRQREIITDLIDQDIMGY